MDSSRNTRLSMTRFHKENLLVILAMHRKFKHNIAQKMHIIRLFLPFIFLSKYKI